MGPSQNKTLANMAPKQKFLPKLIFLKLESEWADWSTATWSVCDAPCGPGTKYRERKCKDIGGKRTCPMGREGRERREERRCTLGPCEGLINKAHKFFFIIFSQSAAQKST